MAACAPNAAGAAWQCAARPARRVAAPGAGYVFTVFTATYNRAHVLHRVYHSLRAQTFRDFEWLVVDDGSSDGTGALVAGWRAEAECLLSPA